MLELPKVLAKGDFPRMTLFKVQRVFDDLVVMFDAGTSRPRIRIDEPAILAFNNRWMYSVPWMRTAKRFPIRIRCLVTVSAGKPGFCFGAAAIIADNIFDIG